MGVFDILDGDQQQDGKPTATRRQVLGATAATATTAIAGCQTGTNGSDDQPEDTQSNGGEFSIEQFLVEGEQPEEYEAEFIAGNNPEEVAQELQPELNYTITGAEGPIKTQTTFEYSDQTIPEGEPLNQTIEGKTHQQNGEHTQTPQMPNSLVSEILQNSKNLQATFTTKDTQTGKTQTQQYQLNFADSFAEQIINESFNTTVLESATAEAQEIEAGEGIIEIEYDSEYNIGDRGFEKELSRLAGTFSGVVETTRTPYELNLKVNGNDGETYTKSLSDELQKEYLDGEIREDMLGTKIYFEELKPE
jgi:hypothetical protein